MGAITPHPQPRSHRGRGALGDRGTANFVLEVRQGRDASAASPPLTAGCLPPSRSPPSGGRCCSLSRRGRVGVEAKNGVCSNRIWYTMPDEEPIDCAALPGSFTGDTHAASIRRLDNDHLARSFWIAAAVSGSAGQSAIDPRSGVPAAYLP